MKLIILITVIILIGGFFIYRGQTAPPHSTPSQLPASSLKLYSLGIDNKTFTPPRTIFKAEEPVTFILTFEKKPTSFWPFVKEAHAEDNTQGITTELTFNNGEAKDITVEMKPLEESKFSFSLKKKDPSQLQPGKYQFKVTREAGGQTQTLTQDFAWGVLAINPNKSIYLPGEEALLGIGVLNDSGRTICNAAITLEITDPSGIKTVLSEENTSLRKSGQCQETSVTNIPDYLAGYKVGKAGVYKMHLTADNGNGVRSLDDSFEVRNSVPFDIERTSYPMRIYPRAEYTGKITVLANQDFKGSIEESVPSSFEISKIASSQTPRNDVIASVAKQSQNSKLITWNVAWKKGQTYTLSYSIKFPQISPEFYLVGPLRFCHPERSEGSLDSKSGDSSQARNDKTCSSAIFQEARQWQIASDAVTTTFMESGTDATQGFEFWSTAGGTPAPTSDTAVVKTGPRSIKFDSSTSNGGPFVGISAVLADAGRRISAYFNFTGLPTSSMTRFFMVRTSGGGAVIGLRINQNGVLETSTGTARCGTVAGSTLSTGTWYRIALSYVITSTTNFTVKTYLNGTLDMTATNADCTLTNATSSLLRLGWDQAPGANKVLNIDDIYIDNGTGVDDPGDIRVTAKLPASDNSCVDGCPFDTAVGASPGAGSRYTNVNERPLSGTNGWRQNASTQVRENFGIQAISAGDVDFSGNYQVAYVGWIRAATSASASTAAITVNGTDTSISTTTTATIFTSYVDSTTYPTNAATIGILSTGTATDTIIDEAGIVFAYIPISRVKFNGIKMQGIQVK